MKDTNVAILDSISDDIVNKTINNSPLLIFTLRIVEKTLRPRQKQKVKADVIHRLRYLE